MSDNGSGDPRVPPMILLELSDFFDTEYECRQLAICLGLSDRLVDRLQAKGSTDPHLIALVILRKWDNTEGSLSKLYSRIRQRRSFQEIGVVNAIEGKLSEQGIFDFVIRPHQNIFLFPVAKVKKGRVGRSAQNFFLDQKCWPWLTTQYPPDVEEQCGTPISGFIVYTSSCATGWCGSQEALNLMRRSTYVLTATN